MAEPENEPLKSVTFKLSQRDIDRLDEVVEDRYPEDRHMRAQVLRELIRAAQEKVRERKLQRDSK